MRDACSTLFGESCVLSRLLPTPPRRHAVGCCPSRCCSMWRASVRWCGAPTRALCRRRRCRAPARRHCVLRAVHVGHHGQAERRGCGAAVRGERGVAHGHARVGARRCGVHAVCDVGVLRRIDRRAVCAAGVWRQRGGGAQSAGAVRRERRAGGGGAAVRADAAERHAVGRADAARHEAHAVGARGAARRRGAAAAHVREALFATLGEAARAW